ncbi:hypothetical protein ACFWYW_55505 [Nonomuraea sp. NPDC059023]|uniref:hypothetical protein n=1 Tax=unclassified Nonomuraea TaxID=2593643 RepID=UPI0036AC0C7A
MALLDETNRVRTFAQWMRTNLENCGFTKAQLRAALDATDQWIEDKQVEFNQALPAAFRTNASLAQKTLLFCFVAMRRANRLKAEED